MTTSNYSALFYHTKLACFIKILLIKKQSITRFHFFVEIVTSGEIWNSTVTGSFTFLKLRDGVVIFCFFGFSKRNSDGSVSGFSHCYKEMMKYEVDFICSFCYIQSG